MKTLQVAILAMLLLAQIGVLSAKSDTCQAAFKIISELPRIQAQKPASLRNLEPLAPHIDKKDLIRDLEENPNTRILIDRANFRVIAAQGMYIPFALHEIGLLREEEFRNEGEGSGKSIDVDLFDKFYHHIIVYEKRSHTIVGIYRVARLGDLVTEEKLEQSADPLFYSSTLFRFKRPFLVSRAKHTIEFGRAVVKKTYQGSEVFGLLWKGIVQFIMQSDPNYYLLEGPASISDSYPDLIKQILLAYLRKRQNIELGQNLIPNLVPNFQVVDEEGLKPAIALIENLRDLSELVEELGGKEAPQLLSHYDLLGAEILNFNQDELFGNSIDVYTSVDLRRTPRVILKKFFGAQGVERFKFQP